MTPMTEAQRLRYGELVQAEQAFRRTQGRYNHAFSIAFSLNSDRKDGSDIPPERFAIALLRRVADLLEHDEMIEAVGAPDDTYDDAEGTP